MKSQVSFKIDGKFNKLAVIAILKNKIKDIKVETEDENEFVYRYYVASPSYTTNEVYDICYTIQCYAVRDDTYEFKD